MTWGYHTDEYSTCAAEAGEGVAIWLTSKEFKYSSCFEEESRGGVDDKGDELLERKNEITYLLHMTWPLCYSNWPCHNINLNVNFT